MATPKGKPNTQRIEQVELPEVVYIEEITETVEEITETVDESFSVFKTTISSSYGGVPYVTKVSFEF